jgi:hypothetical protein
MRHERIMAVGVLEVSEWWAQTSRVAENFK